MNAITTRSLARFTVVVALLACTGENFAADHDASNNSNVSNLPAALRSAGIAPSQILDDSQAEEVRGEWVLDFRLGLGHLLFQGTGRTAVEIHTLSAGAWYGKPTAVTLRIGKY